MATVKTVEVVVVGEVAMVETSLDREGSLTPHLLTLTLLPSSKKALILLTLTVGSNILLNILPILPTNNHTHTTPNTTLF